MLTHTENHANPEKLHLPDLTIKGFRGIKDLTIKRLGRVTLLAGKNGAGKTSVLDAVRVYAARGHYSALADTLYEREEIINVLEDGEPKDRGDIAALFYGRHISPDATISIGPSDERLRLTVGVGLRGDRQDIPIHEDTMYENTHTIKVEFQERVQNHPIFLVSPRDSSGQEKRNRENTLFGLPLEIKYNFLGPDLPSNATLSRFWNNVALTDYETVAVDALNLAYGGEVQRVAMIGDDYKRARSSYLRRAMVKMKGEDRPVPLKSLGEGAVRLFGVALALANSRDGFLLIDEAENGIYYSIMRDFWKMVLLTAHKNNVQVLATTHGWDCISGFALAAADCEEVDGALVRIERHDEHVRAVEYSSELLEVAAEQIIEVR